MVHFGPKRSKNIQGHSLYPGEWENHTLRPKTWFWSRYLEIHWGWLVVKDQVEHWEIIEYGLSRIEKVDGFVY